MPCYTSRNLRTRGKETGTSSNGGENGLNTKHATTLMSRQTHEGKPGERKEGRKGRSKIS